MTGAAGRRRAERQRRQYAELAQSSGASLQRLVGDVINLAKRSRSRELEAAPARQSASS
jgi:hypothetical protein